MQEVFRRFSETISAYSGVTHELRGDALVAEFERASDAVTAAHSFQADNTKCNNELSGSIRPEVRIGLALGEVVIADQTITRSRLGSATETHGPPTPGGRWSWPRKRFESIHSLDGPTSHSAGRGSPPVMRQPR